MNLSLPQIEFFCTSCLTGLIWTIQLVHYPAFQFVERKRFLSFMHFHTRMISYLVIPLMIFELVLSLYSSYRLQVPSAYLGSACLILIWLSTFLLSVPCHEGLIKQGYNEKMIQRLILTNWPRTILWSLKACLMILG